MNNCSVIQKKITEYLDGRLNGAEMQQVTFHLQNCRKCEQEFASLHSVQTSLSRLEAVPAPKDLPLRIRVVLSRERARSKQGFFHGWNLVWKNTVGPLLLQTSAGLVSAVLLIGSVAVLVGLVARPEVAQAVNDEPIGSPTAPHVINLTNSGVNPMDAFSAPVVVEVSVNKIGLAYDYRIVAGPDDDETRAQVENILLTSTFEPAKYFGLPVRGMAVISFSGVSVRG